jgi:hypothetical protein
MHWFPRFAICLAATSATKYAFIGLLDYWLAFAPPGALGNVGWYLHFFNIFGVPTVPIVCWVILTRIYPPMPIPDPETRCRKCGYILRGLSEPRCSECGEVI